MTDTQSAYLEVIADLKRRRDGIDQLIGEIEALVGGQGPLRGMKVLDAAKAVLRENGKPMAPAAITEQIQAGGCEVSSANTVASILNRYSKDNDDVFSPERGLWAIHSDTVQDEPMSGASAALTQGLGSGLPPATSVPMLDASAALTQGLGSGLPPATSVPMLDASATLTQGLGSGLPPATSVPMLDASAALTQGLGSGLPPAISVPMLDASAIGKALGSGLSSVEAVPTGKTAKRRS